MIDVLYGVGCRVGPSVPYDIEVVSWGVYNFVAKFPLNLGMDGVALHLSVPDLEILLYYGYFELRTQLQKSITQVLVSILITSSVTPCMTS